MSGEALEISFALLGDARDIAIFKLKARTDHFLVLRSAWNQGIDLEEQKFPTC